MASTLILPARDPAVPLRTRRSLRRAMSAMSVAARSTR